MSFCVAREEIQRGKEGDTERMEGGGAVHLSCVWFVGLCVCSGSYRCVRYAIKCGPNVSKATFTKCKRGMVCGWKAARGPVSVRRITDRHTPGTESTTESRTEAKKAEKRVQRGNNVDLIECKTPWFLLSFFASDCLLCPSVSLYSPLQPHVAYAISGVLYSTITEATGDSLTSQSYLPPLRKVVSIWRAALGWFMGT